MKTSSYTCMHAIDLECFSLWRRRRKL